MQLNGEPFQTRVRQEPFDSNWLFLTFLHFGMAEVGRTLLGKCIKVEGKLVKCSTKVVLLYKAKTNFET